MDQFMLMAHRGGSGHHLENTLPAFEHAIRSGCDAAELDVHLTLDGQLVVHHNSRLNRQYTRALDGHWLTAAEEVPIGTLTLAQLKRYRLDGLNPCTGYGRRFPELVAMAGQAVPTLAEVVAAVRALPGTCRLVVEIKSGCRFVPRGRRWQPLVDAVLAELDRLRFGPRTILCGFDWRALRYASQKQPGIPIWLTTDPFDWRDGSAGAATGRAADAVGAARRRCGWCVACWYDVFQPASGPDAPRAVQAAGGDAWFAYHADCTDEALAAARALQVPVAA